MAELVLWFFEIISVMADGCNPKEGIRPGEVTAGICCMPTVHQDLCQGTETQAGKLSHSFCVHARNRICIKVSVILWLKTKACREHGG